MEQRPLFSVGVTTYRRPDFLRKCVASVLAQTHADFEVIVGNDYPPEPVLAAELAAGDPRVRVVNRPSNLGELGNMNALLAEARGRYFTWLADDDSYSPRFLASVAGALAAHGEPPVVFTGYAMGSELREEVGAASGSSLLDGRSFLRRYLSRSIDVLGCYGVWDSERLRRLGGMEKLGSGFSPYSDNLLCIRAGLLDRVAFIEAPLILFRTHPDSISWTSSDLDSYVSAQMDLCRRAGEVFREESVRGDLEENLHALLSRWFLPHFYAVAARNSSLELRKWPGYFEFVERAARDTGFRRYRTLLAALLGLRVVLKSRLLRALGRAAPVPERPSA